MRSQPNTPDTPLLRNAASEMDLKQVITPDFVKITLEQPLQITYRHVVDRIRTKILALSLQQDAKLRDSHFSKARVSSREQIMTNQPDQKYEDWLDAEQRFCAEHSLQEKATQAIQEGVAELMKVAKSILCGLRDQGFLNMDAMRVLVSFKREVMRLQNTSADGFLHRFPNN